MITRKKLQEKYFKESGLSRIFGSMTDHDCGAITAFRSYIKDKNGNKIKLSHAQNIQRNRKLLAQLQFLDYSVTSIKGSMIENFGSDDSDSPPVEVQENTFFVVDFKDKGKLKSDLLKLGEECFQDNIMFIKKGKISKKTLGKDITTQIEIKACLIGTQPDDEDLYFKYHVETEFETVHIGSVDTAINQFFSRINGRPFFFEKYIREHDTAGNIFSKRGLVKIIEEIDSFEGNKQ